MIMAFSKITYLFASYEKRCIKVLLRPENPPGTREYIWQHDWTYVSAERDTSPKELGEKAFAGAALMVGTRFAIRLLGLISVTVLARLLTPDDFGLFGTAALALGFFLLLKEVGFSEAVIKEKELTKADIDTLWTMSLILSAITGLALFLAAPFITGFLKDGRVELVLQVMALLPIIDALASPASSLLLRELRYGTDFLLKSGNKIVRVVAVIVVAIMLKSYWALVFGALLSSVFGVIISHIVRPYRPRLTLEKLKKHRGFALWAYLRSVALYLASTSDEFVIRSSANTAFFGIYHISRDLARVLILDLIGPVREAMLPALAKMQDDPTRHAEAVSNILGASVIVGAAISFGIMVTSHELVLLLLGNQWTAAAPYLSLLAIGCACNAIGEVNQSSFITAGLQKKSALSWALRAVAYGAGCITAGLIYGPKAVAITFSALSLVSLIVETLYMFRCLGVTPHLLAVVFRPLISAGLMAIAVYSLPIPDHWSTVVTLLSKVTVGAAIYGVLLLGLWKLSGYKKGPEYTLYHNLPKKIQKLVPISVPDTF